MSPLPPQTDTPAQESESKPKRRAATRDEKFTNIVLYREDLEEIYKKFHKASKASNKVNISTEEYELTDIQQLFKLDLDTIEEITFSIQNPYLRLTINPLTIYLSTIEVTPESLFALNEVKSILDRRKAPILWRLSHSWISYGIAVLLLNYTVTAPLIYRLLNSANTPTAAAVSGLAQFLVSAIILFILLRLKVHRTSKIYLDSRRDHPPLSKRLASAKLEVEVVKYVLGGIIGGLITWLLFKLGLAKP